MPLIIAVAFAAASYLVIRALAVEGRAPTSAWREATFGASQPTVAARSSGPALRTKSILERVFEALPRLDRMQAPAQRMVESAGLSTRFTGGSLMGLCAVLATAGVLGAVLFTSRDGFTPRELVAIPVGGLLGLGAPLISDLWSVETPSLSDRAFAAGRPRPGCGLGGGRARARGRVAARVIPRCRSSNAGDPTHAERSCAWAPPI